MVNELHIARQPRGGDSSAPHLKAFSCFAVQLPFAFLYKKNIIGLWNLNKFCWLRLVLWRSGQIPEHYKMLLQEIIWLDLIFMLTPKLKLTITHCFLFPFSTYLIEGEENCPNTKCIIYLRNVMSSQHFPSCCSDYRAGQWYKTTGILLNLLIIKHYLVDMGLKFWAAPYSQDFGEREM